MKKLLGLSLSALLMTSVTAPAATVAGDALDFHLFESQFARSGDVSEGYQQVHEAVAVGQDVGTAVAVLRHAGARCQSTRTHTSALECSYSEVLEVADYTKTYATWDVTLQLSAGKVAAVTVERGTYQAS